MSKRNYYVPKRKGLLRMNIPSVSPTSASGSMSFSEAIKYTLINKHIHKLEWGDPEYYGVLDGGTLKLHKPDGLLYQWILSTGDIMGEDWTVL